MQSRALFIAILLAGFALPAAPPHLHADARPAQTLTALVGPHGLTRDTNGDNLADIVAARLGYETHCLHAAAGRIELAVVILHAQPTAAGGLQCVSG